EHDVGRQVARGVEALWVDALVGYPLRAGRLLAGHPGAQGPRTPHDLVQRARVRGGDLDPAERGVGLVLANPELLDIEGAPEVHHEVQELWQNHRVDNVALQCQQRRGLAGRHLLQTVASTELMAAFRAAASLAGSSA